MKSLVAHSSKMPAAVQADAASSCAAGLAKDPKWNPSSKSKTRRSPSSRLQLALLTGGGDRPYALGLSSALSDQGVSIDFIGSNDLDLPEVRSIRNLQFHNLRGDQRPNVSLRTKALRICAYYARLFYYAATARPRVFHILWNDKFEFFDRSVLMLYYRLLGKRVALTAHNVNARKRDGTDTGLNRLSLRMQYKLAHHIFVHTAKMKDELKVQFGVGAEKVSVIPLGVNNTVPVTNLGTDEAKRRLGLRPDEKTLLFFGRIAPYKGLEYLTTALTELSKTSGQYRLIIAGSIKDCDEYWQRIKAQVSRDGIRSALVEHIAFIPDHETELYFKAADVLILPYVDIFQSGVLSLGYSFGLPVIAADVGSLREDIVEGKTGYIFKPKDAADLARVIQLYFSSSLFRQLSSRRAEIQAYANDRYSWSKVGEITRAVYERMSAEKRS